MAVDNSVYPYSAIVRISYTRGGQAFQASGVMVSPDEVLTATHVVYNSATGLSNDIVVSSGYGGGAAPFGSATAASVHYNPIQDATTIALSDVKLDYAIIHLSRPLGAGVMSLGANFAGGKVNTTGYPTSAGTAIVDSQQTVSLDTVTSRFIGVTLGPGSSGAPVWIYGADGAPTVVGVVSGQSGNAGFDAQLTTSSVAAIRAWIAGDDAVTAIAGTASADLFAAGGGNKSIDGAGGHDALALHGNRIDYAITGNGSGAVTIVDSVVGRDGFDTVTNVEYVRFVDKTVFVENADNANVARLYAAAFNRQPDVGGLNFWEDIYANNVSSSAKTNDPTAVLGLAGTIPRGATASIAQSFIVSAEFQSIYGTLSDAAFVTQLYANVLGRPPDSAGLSYWQSLLATGGNGARAAVLVDFAESPENIAATGYSASHNAGWLFAI